MNTKTTTHVITIEGDVGTRICIGCKNIAMGVTKLFAQKGFTALCLFDQPIPERTPEEMKRAETLVGWVLNSIEPESRGNH